MVTERDETDDELPRELDAVRSAIDFRADHAGLGLPLGCCRIRSAPIVTRDDASAIR
jgi:hypothetical protein